MPYRRLPLLLSALVACGGSGAGAPAAPSVSDLVVLPGEAVESVPLIRWTTPVPATSHAELWLDGVLARVASADTLTTEHALRVQGLKAGRTYELVVRSVADGEEATATATVEVAGAPAWIPEWTASDLAPDRHGNSLVLLSVTTGTDGGAVLVDRDGDPVWWAHAGHAVLSTTSFVRAAGDAVLVSAQDQDMAAESRGAIQAVALDGSVAETLVAPGLHHAFTELPDGSLAYLAADIRDYDGADVVGDVVRVRAPDGEVTEVFNAWDHYVPSGWCSHYQPVAYARDAIDWLHANSLAWDAGRGRLLIMAHNKDAFLEIDLATGQPGAEIGGPDSVLAPEDPIGDPWDHPHFSTLTADGVLLMDNGAHRDPPVSRAVEYVFDREAGTYHRTWSYQTPDATYVFAVGDVERLADGNRLVSWTTAGFVTELADQDVVWRLDAELGVGLGWVAAVELPGAAE